MKIKVILSVLAVTVLLGSSIAMQTVFASGTAQASATAVGDGVNCGSVSKPSGTNTGAMTVVEVLVNGKAHGYTVTPGTNGSTRPRLTFNPALKDKDVVEITLSTIHEGTFRVNLTLEKKKGDC